MLKIIIDGGEYGLFFKEEFLVCNGVQKVLCI